MFEKILVALTETPIPNLVVLGGLAFFLLGIANFKKSKYLKDMKPGVKRTSRIFGGILVLLGLISYFAPPFTKPIDSPTSTPTTIPETAAVPSEASDIASFVITEILANPCRPDSRNEFVEIYNSGQDPIDVSGLWITDGDDTDLIVSWEFRYPDVKLSAITDSTIIPSHGFGVILAPGYILLDKEDMMQYSFPPNTILLTTDKGQRIGDETNGIESTNNRDPIVLYEGTYSVIERVISTYGSLFIDNSPFSITDDGLDKIPYDASAFDCGSFQRRYATNEDVEGNWNPIPTSNPGAGNEHYPP